MLTLWPVSAGHASPAASGYTGLGLDPASFPRVDPTAPGPQGHRPN